MTKIKRISIEGNIGSGIDVLYPLLKQYKDKITTTETLDLIKKIEQISEVDENLKPCLLKDPMKNCFSFIIRSFLDKYSNEITVSKRSFLSDVCRLETFFELNYITINEYNICKDLYRTMEDKFVKFEETMFIYIKSNENLCYERLIEQEVKHLDFNYITTLNKHYDDYFLASKKDNVLVVDYDYKFDQLVVLIQSFYQQLLKTTASRLTPHPQQIKEGEWTVVSRTKKKNKKQKKKN